MTYIPVDPYTPHTDRAEHQIRRMLRYILTQTTLPLPYLKALAVMDYVAGHLSAPLYGDMVHRREPLPTGGRNAVIAEKALAAGAGLCGQAAATALVLYDRLGLRARQVDITHDLGVHTTVEVRYDHGWHWFDPTFGYWYLSDDGVASAEDVMSAGGLGYDRMDMGLWGAVAWAEDIGRETGHSILLQASWSLSVRPPEKPE